MPGTSATSRLKVSSQWCWLIYGSIIYNSLNFCCEKSIAFYNLKTYQFIIAISVIFRWYQNCGNVSCNELFSKFKIGCLATRSVRSGQLQFSNNTFIQTPTLHPHRQTATHNTGNVCIHVHIHIHVCIAVNCSCKVQASITTTKSDSQTLNFEKSPLRQSEVWDSIFPKSIVLLYNWDNNFFLRSLMGTFVINTHKCFKHLIMLVCNEETEDLEGANNKVSPSGFGIFLGYHQFDFFWKFYY